MLREACGAFFKTGHCDEPKPGYRIEVGTPDEFEDLPAIERLLERRGHVALQHLRTNLPDARVIAIARHRADVVAACVLKGMNRRHNATVGRQSGYQLAPEVPELGYAATHEQHTNALS